MLLCAFAAVAVHAQTDARRALARDLARLLVEDPSRPAIEEQVRVGMMQFVASSLEERLNRRLQDVEWQMVGSIVGRFVAEALAPPVPEQVAAEVYAHHFDEQELRELLAFQRSPTGRKAWRLNAVIARDTAQGLDREMRRSPAAGRMLDELRRAFPILGPETP
jgi:hypothetical protein